jgi:hypothetical protein
MWGRVVLLGVQPEQAVRMSFRQQMNLLTIHAQIEQYKADMMEKAARR